MILGTGCDILEIDRIERLKAKYQLNKIFTEEERRQAMDQTSMLAGDFSVKEAVSKCFGTGVRGFSLRDIEVLRDNLGKPYVNLYAGALELFKMMNGNKIHVTISNTKELVYANAVIEGEKEENYLDKSINDVPENLKLPHRLNIANKGTYGKLLILAGSEGMSGAAYLSSLAAYRCGAGLIRILTVESNREILQILLPEAIVVAYKETDDVSEIIKKQCEWADFIVAGPGLGISDQAKKNLLDIIQFGRAPLLLDADALNIISKNDEILDLLVKYGEKFPIAVTPHPMEMARLLKLKIEEVLNSPEDAANKFSKKCKCITVMKGPETTVVVPHVHEDTGEILYFESFKNHETSAALAKAGSGDVLSGCIAGIYEILKAEREMGTQSNLVSDINDLRAFMFKACCSGVVAHAKAGNIAAKSLGEHSVLARDTANFLGSALESLTI